jgi:WD40 repeat protein
LKNHKFPSWKEKFRVPLINQDEVNDLLSKLNENIKNIEFHLGKIKKDLLLNETIQFKQLEKSSLFGHLKIRTNKVVQFNTCELIRTYTKHTGTIRSIQVDNSQNKLISSSEDKTIKIWNLETGECLNALTDHTNWVTSILILQK